MAKIFDCAAKHSFCPKKIARIKKEFLFYLLFGGTAAIVNIAAGYVFYTFSSLPYAFSVCAGAFLGMIVNFILNYFFNFRNCERAIARQFAVYLLVSLAGIALTGIISDIALRFLEISFPRVVFPILSLKFIAQAFAVGTVVIYSFLANKFLVFAPGKKTA